MREGTIARSGHSGEAVYNILSAVLSKHDEVRQDAEKWGGVVGTIPVLAQRAA